jgi:oligopeptide transport system substrate-binding protein
VWSDDRLTLTVKLRPDGRWSNGDPVVAQDFVRAWRRLIRQDMGSSAVLLPLRNAEAILQGKITDTSALGVEAVDDLTLRIRLTAVRSTLVAELADPLLVPLHKSTAAVLQAKSHLQEPDRLVTNGAFQLDRAGAEVIRLRASGYYHGHATVRLGGVEFIQADSAAMARLLVAVGRADIASPPPDRMHSALPTNRRVMEASELALTVSSLDLNMRRAPLSDRRVRCALALAVNRAASIPEMDADRLVPAYSWVPDMPGRPGLALLRENAAEARRLLAEAGYPGGRGFPVLIMPVNVTRDQYGYLQAWTERWFQVLGVRTYLAFEPADKRRWRMESGSFDIILNGLIATVPDAGDLLGVFAHPERFNATHKANPEITQMMDEANRKTGNERLSLLEQIERRALEDVPTIPMMFERRRTLLASEVDGWYADPLGRQALKRLAIRPPGGSDATVGRSTL